jgi:hypothetical protein
MLLYHQWLSLPLTTRNKIAAAFGIIKKDPTEVASNVVRYDGYRIIDIETALTLHSLQKYLGTTETDSHILWNYLIDKMEGKNIVIIDPVVLPPPEPEPIPPKPRGRPKKTK